MAQLYLKSTYQIAMILSNRYGTTTMKAAIRKKYFGRENKYRFLVADVFAVICDGEP